MTGWAATKGTPTTGEAELAWWRQFACKVENLPPVGSPLLGRRLRLVDADSGEVLPWGLYRPDRVALRSQEQADRARLLGAGP